MMLTLLPTTDDAYSTLPGFHVKITEGQMLWRPLHPNKDKRFQNTIKMETEYLKAKLEVKDPQITFRMSAGPAWKFHLLPMGSASMAPKFALTGISDPLAMGGHVQPIRMDHIISVARPDDNDCAPGQVKYELVLRTGMDAYVMVFFQRVVDLGWIPALQKSNIASEMVNGLWFSKRLAVKCLPILLDMGGANVQINKWLSELQEPIAKAVAKIGQFVSSTADRPGFEKGIQSWRAESNNNSEAGRELIDMLGWMHYLDKSDPGLKWLDCESHHPGCNTSDPFQVADMSDGECSEVGLCDPESEFYIPPGVDAGSEATYDDWLHRMGFEGKFLDQKFDAMAIFEKGSYYNSSTVVVASTTPIPVPTSIPCDNDLPSGWCKGFLLNYNASTAVLASTTTTLTSISTSA